MRIAFYTGPIGVHEIAEGMRASGINVTCEGTERVHVDEPSEPGDSVDDVRARVVEKLKKGIGKTYGLEQRRFFD